MLPSSTSAAGNRSRLPWLLEASPVDARRNPDVRDATATPGGDRRLHMGHCPEMLSRSRFDGASSFVWASASDTAADALARVDRLNRFDSA